MQSYSLENSGELELFSTGEARLFFLNQNGKVGGKAIDRDTAHQRSTSTSSDSLL